MNNFEFRKSVWKLKDVERLIQLRLDPLLSKADQWILVSSSLLLPCKILKHLWSSRRLFSNKSLIFPRDYFYLLTSKFWFFNSLMLVYEQKQMFLKRNSFLLKISIIFSIIMVLIAVGCIYMKKCRQHDNESQNGTLHSREKTPVSFL